MKARFAKAATAYRRGCHLVVIPAQSQIPVPQIWIRDWLPIRVLWIRDLVDVRVMTIVIGAKFAKMVVVCRQVFPRSPTPDFRFTVFRFAPGLLSLVALAACPEAVEPIVDAGPSAPPPAPVCGNGVLEVDEACDDGNRSNEDGCSDVCSAETLRFTQLALSLSGSERFSCGLSVGGRLFCWGDNSFGALGDGGLEPMELGASLRPLRTGAVRSVHAGGAHACAILSGGSVRCWGLATRGQIGEGDEGLLCGARERDRCRVLPAPLPMADEVLQLELGVAHTCALLETGRVLCWGANGFKQVGDSTNTSVRADAVEQRFLPDADLLALGSFHNCARDRSGNVWCWGRGDLGQLGNGSLFDSWRPVLVEGVRDVAGLALGRAHSCAAAAGASAAWPCSAPGP